MPVCKFCNFVVAIYQFVSSLGCCRSECPEFSLSLHILTCCSLLRFPPVLWSCIFLGLLSCIAGPISRGPTQRGQAIGPLCCVQCRGTQTMGGMGVMTAKRPCASLWCLVQLLHLAGHRCTLYMGLKNKNKFTLNGG